MGSGQLNGIEIARQIINKQRDMNEIIIYKVDDNSPTVEVNIENDTIWLTQKQIAMVFGTKVPAINKHIKNIVKEKELSEEATISKMETVRREGKRSVKRKEDIYNLDMIISVGYRINSSRATQFRIWATQRLKDYLVKGYANNQKRLEQLQKVVEVIQQSGNAENIHLSEAKGLLDVLSNYTHSFILLNQYDSNNLSAEKLHKKISYKIQYVEAVTAIEQLRKGLIAKKEATSLFGNQKDDSFEGTLQSIVQTFDGNYLYPSIEEQAPPISCISLSKTTPSAMATNALALLCLCGF